MHFKRAILVALWKMESGEARMEKSIKEGVIDLAPPPDDIQINHVILNKSLLLPGPELCPFIN